MDSIKCFLHSTLLNNPYTTLYKLCLFTFLSTSALSFPFTSRTPPTHPHFIYVIFHTNTFKITCKCDNLSLKILYLEKINWVFTSFAVKHPNNCKFDRLISSSIYPTFLGVLMNIFLQKISQTASKYSTRNPFTEISYFLFFFSAKKVGCCYFFAWEINLNF